LRQLTTAVFYVTEAAEDDTMGPVFMTEPPNRVDFSNTTGAVVECSARGSPPPEIIWVRADGTAVGDVPGLRQVSDTRCNIPATPTDTNRIGNSKYHIYGRFRIAFSSDIQSNNTVMKRFKCLIIYIFIHVPTEEFVFKSLRFIITMRI
jgi:hypothetical protein